MDPPGSSGVLPHRIPGTSRGGDLARPSPPKPWERNSSSSLTRPSAIGSPSTALTTTSSTPTNTTTTTTTTPRPPLRPWERRTEYGRDYDTGYGYGRDPYYNNRDRYGYGSSYGNYGSRDSYGGYGGYGGNGYGSNGGYGSYGNYGGYGNSGYGYGGYGNSGYSGYGGYGYRDPYDKSGFHQVLANGNSFFSNLQYFVDSFGRFSRLLDANYDAMHGSFASVVRLLEHMGRLNSEVMTVIKTFTLFRIMQSLVTRCFGVFKYILGRRGGDSRLVGGVEGAGNTSSLLDVNDFRDFARGGVKMIPSPGQHGANPQAPPSWRGLLLVFVVTFVGLPMVVNKLFTLLARRNELELEWSKEGRGEQVVALHDFEGESQRELSFRKGDTLYIINKFHPDWWEASCDGRVGIIPANYVSAATEGEPESLHDEFKSAAK